MVCVKKLSCTLILTYFILVSECLQYPDFSCVAVYRKIVIGFAFLVPDASYIEAYVSFIFTHPEWRRKGVAKFMLYHLIQVINYERT